MDTEECVPTQHFYIPILDVELLMLSYGRGVDGKLVVGGICDCEVEGRSVIRSVIRSVRDREVGQSGDAGGWRLCDGRFRSRVRFQGGYRFERRGLRDVRFEISVREPQGCDNGRRSGVSRASRFRGSRSGREAFPSMLP